MRSARVGLLAVITLRITKQVGRGMDRAEATEGQTISEVHSLALMILVGSIEFALMVRLLGGSAPTATWSAGRQGPRTTGRWGCIKGENASTCICKALACLGELLALVYCHVCGAPMPASPDLGFRALGEEADHCSDDVRTEYFIEFFQKGALMCHLLRTEVGAEVPDWEAIAIASLKGCLHPRQQLDDSARRGAESGRAEAQRLFDSMNRSGGRGGRGTPAGGRGSGRGSADKAATAAAAADPSGTPKKPKLTQQERKAKRALDDAAPNDDTALVTVPAATTSPGGRAPKDPARSAARAVALAAFDLKALPEISDAFSPPAPDFGGLVELFEMAHETAHPDRPSTSQPCAKLAIFDKCKMALGPHGCKRCETGTAPDKKICKALYTAADDKLKGRLANKSAPWK